MTVYRIDPLKDPRWPAFLQTEPRASVFHTPGWLKALRDSYGYEPFALTTSPPNRALGNGLVFCQISSWLTGARVVSLPFSDHCDPLVEDGAALMEILSFIRGDVDGQSSKYVEIRPRAPLGAEVLSGLGLGESASFSLHTLDLRRSLDDLFRSFHKNSIQKAVQRAERERIQVEDGRSEVLLHEFYRLLMLTRRRHQLPPQPLVWFQNLIKCFGDNLTLRVACKDGQPIAGILTIACEKSLVYKYACSDANFHNLGAVPLLLWQAIQEGKARQVETLDLGRSDLDNPGLITFKERWGAQRSQLTYYRYPSSSLQSQSRSLGMEMARRVFSVLPDSWLNTTGRFLYRHVG